jgi:hypothetical protein|tara:strand:- start:793 stop:1152 length:360 start_codon:yes stop_codon:yes gene_type:complete
MEFIMIYGEITKEGHLVEISYTKPEYRKPQEGSIIVELRKYPSEELSGKPVKYDKLKKEARLDEEAYAKEQKADKRRQILDLIRHRNEINEAIEITGLDYSEELNEIEAQLLELTNELE